MACTLFETLSNAGTLTAEFYEQDEKCTYVDLYTDGINIREALIRENFAKSATKATEGNQVCRQFNNKKTIYFLRSIYLASEHCMNYYSLIFIKETNIYL